MDLLRLARPLCDTQQDAEDLTQDALIRVMCKWEIVRQARDPLAYARRLLVNEHHSQHRKKRLPIVHRVRANDSVAVDSTDGVDSRLWIQSALRKLSTTQRTVLVLHYYLQLTDREIAEWTGLRRSSVRASLSRATKALRRHASPEPQEQLTTEVKHHGSL